MRLPPVIALQGVFAMNAMAISLWFPRIPDVKSALALDYRVLSLCLLGLPLGLMIGFLTAPRILHWLHHRRTIVVFGILHPLLMIPPAFAASPMMLFLALAIAGWAMSNIEIGMNAKTNVVQEALGRRIMSRCHGMWSIGGMFGALIGGWCAKNSISFAEQQMIFEPLVATLATIFALSLPVDAATETEPKQAGFGIPSGPLLVLCLLPLGALIIEGTMLDWSVLYAREILFAGPFEASAIFAVFAVSMGLWRIAGDTLTEMLGVATILILSGIALVVGVLLFVATDNLLISGLGAFIAGFGSANPYPLAISLSHHLPGRSREGNVATIAIAAFTVFLVGPPLIGFLADSFGLSRAFLALIPFALIAPVLVLTGAVHKEATP